MDLTSDQSVRRNSTTGDLKILNIIFKIIFTCAVLSIVEEASVEVLEQFERAHFCRRLNLQRPITRGRIPNPSEPIPRINIAAIFASSKDV